MYPVPLYAVMFSVTLDCLIMLRVRSGRSLGYRGNTDHCYFWVDGLLIFHVDFECSWAVGGWNQLGLLLMSGRYTASAWHGLLCVFRM